MKFNPEKHYLGTLCKRGHEWEKSGQSLRYIRSTDCIMCGNEYMKIWNKKNSDKRKKINQRYNKNNIKKNRETQKKWRQNNPHKIKEYTKRRYKKWLKEIKKTARKNYNDNPVKFRERQKEYYYKNIEASKQSSTNWKNKNKNRLKKYRKKYEANNPIKVKRWSYNKYWRNPIKQRKRHLRERNWKQIINRSPKFKPIIEAWINYKIAILNLQKLSREALL
jgi:hypothetical protein